jgi:predicted HNH restriction endonuclease
MKTLNGDEKLRPSIRTLATEINVSHKVLIPFLQKKGFSSVDSIMSKVEPDALHAVMQQFGKEKSSAEKRQKKVAAFKEKLNKEVSRRKKTARRARRLSSAEINAARKHRNQTMLKRSAPRRDAQERGNEVFKSETRSSNQEPETVYSRHIENMWIPKLLEDSNAFDRQTTDDFAPAEIIRETEAMTEDLDLLDSVGEENQRKLVSHLRRERSAGLRNKKIKAVIAEKHDLKCEVCDFDFEDAYGKLGKGFAEVHHIIPLSTLGETKTKLSDLAVLCSNCHRMIHRTNPIEDLETFRVRIQAIRAEGT